MHVEYFVVADQVEILEFTQAGPEVIAVEHGPDVRVRGRARHFERCRKSADEGSAAHELEHSRYAIRFDDITGFAQIVATPLVVVRRELAGSAARAHEAIHSQ